MTALNASTVPLAVRVKNGRVDQLLTGYLVGAPKFTKTDPGGHRAGSFVVSSRLGFRSDMIQPYSRIYFYNKRNGDCLFEGDVTHPGRSVGEAGELLEVQVDGGAERLNDWSGARIFIDRDMQAWTKTTTSIVSTTVEVGDDRGGSGNDALTLAFPMNQHVENTHRVEAGYYRVRDAGQELGWLNYAWDAGLTNASWLARSIVTPPSTVARSQGLSTAGSGGSGAVVGGAIPAGANVAYLQLIWTSGPSSTGSSGNDVVWVSYTRPIIICRLKLKDGTFKTGASYVDTITAADVWHDMLGTELLEDAYDGANATVETGTSQPIYQMAYPDGVTPQQVADDLLQFEPGMTYYVGASKPGVDKYSFKWISRSTTVRYEAVVWVDEHTGGIQPVEQYNEVVARWKTPVGNIRMTTSTQSIPEMTAAGRTRRYFHDLGKIMGDSDNVTTTNAAVLADHRYPKNTGRVRISRKVVDLFTGRRVEPFEIEPGYMIRLVGVDPKPDALNATTPNGSTVCRIVNTDYSGDDHSVDLDLDAVPLSMFRAIARTKPRSGPQHRT